MGILDYIESYVCFSLGRTDLRPNYWYFFYFKSQCSILVILEAVYK